MDLGIAGKHALVCAASRGLGYATARRLLEEGCKVTICGRHEETLLKAIKTLQSDVPRRSFEPVATEIDLTHVDQHKEFLRRVTAQHGPVDILVNNVGGPAPSSAVETDLDAWKQGFDQLFLSAVNITKLALGPMKERQWGRILTVTSLSVTEPIDHLVVSTAIRTAVTAFMKTLSKEVAPYGVTVNTIQPGVIHTQRIDDLRLAKANREGTTLEAELKKTADHIPMGRLGRPEELADVAAFLVSERASYVTGSSVIVDGGMRHSW